MSEIIVRRVLFFSYALRGHANACLAVAEAMARRGHEVVFAIPAEGRSWVEEIGVRYLAWDPRTLTGESLTLLQRNARADASRQGYWARAQLKIVESATATYGIIRDSAKALMEKVQPDLVTSPETSLPVIDAAESLRIPLAIHAVYLPATLRSRSQRFGGGEGLAWWRQGAQLYWGMRLRAADRRFRQLRQRLAGCDSSPGEILFRHQVLGISADCIEEEERFPVNVHLLGPLRRAPEELSPELVDWLDARRERGVVLAAFGSLVQLSSPQVKALERGLSTTDLPVLWALPKAQQSWLSRRSSSLRIEAFVPQNAVLAHPAIRGFVSHAGGNSFLEAMYWGKPVLAIPFMLDQPYFARRAEELGVGLRLSPAVLNSERVSEGVRRLLNEPAFTTAAEGIAACLRQTPGLRGAVEVLEQMGVAQWGNARRAGTDRDQSGNWG